MASHRTSGASKNRDYRSSSCASKLQNCLPFIIRIIWSEKKVNTTQILLLQILECQLAFLSNTWRRKLRYLYCLSETFKTCYECSIWIFIEQDSIKTHHVAMTADTDAHCSHLDIYISQKYRLCVVKGQTKLRWFFQAHVSSKKWMNKFDFTTMIPQVDLF